MEQVENMQEQELESTQVPSGNQGASGESTTKLEALQSELQQSLLSLEQNFAKKCAEIVNNDSALDELYFEDKEAFFTKILELQNQYIEQEIAPKENAIKEAESEQRFNNELNKLESAKQEFQSRNPNVNVDELLQFYTTLPAEIQAELEKTPSEAIFDTLLQIKQQMQGEAEPQGAQDSAEQGEDLPKQVNGAPAQVSATQSDSDLPTQRY